MTPADALWTAYMRETYKREVLYWDPGTGEPAALMAYELHGPDLYITDMYTTPTFRRAGVGRLLFGRIRAEAVRLGCTRILGTVDATRRGWRESIAAQEAVGFVLSKINDQGQALLIYSLNDAGE